MILSISSWYWHQTVQALAECLRPFTFMVYQTPGIKTAHCWQWSFNPNKNIKLVFCVGDNNHVSTDNGTSHWWTGEFTHPLVWSLASEIYFLSSLNFQYSRENVWGARVQTGQSPTHRTEKHTLSTEWRITATPFRWVGELAPEIWIDF